MDDDGEENGEWDEQTYFVGDCTCDHDTDEHTWGSCGVDDCDCEAGWEE